MRQIHFIVMIRGLLALDSGCPSCKSLISAASQRRSDWERALGVLVLPHRCSKCELRFFRPKWVSLPVPGRHRTGMGEAL